MVAAHLASFGSTSGQRAADLTIEGRSGATSCGAPSVIVGDESGARPQAAGCSLPGPGDNAAVFPRPGARTGPLRSPEEA